MTEYSNSKLSTFEGCPLRFKFAYVDRLKSEVPEGIEGFMGTIVHKTLEMLYKNLQMCKKVTLEWLISSYDEIWKKEWHDDIEVRNGYTAENFKEKGMKFVENYWNRYQPFTSDKTIGIERVINVVLDKKGKYRLTGRIDRLSQPKDGVYEVRDYKTTGRLPTQADMDSDRQLPLYAIAVKKMWTDAKKVLLVWHFLAFDKEMRSERTEEELAKLKNDVMKLINKIEKCKDENTFAPKEGESCKWCGYQDRCPKKKHLLKTGKMPENEFLKEPGVVLANRYAELKEKRARFLEEMDAELEKLEEAIILYAKKHKVEVIRGSDKKLMVKVYMRPTFPGKSEEERKELDKLIKKSGKWIEVSELDTPLLSKIVESPEEFGWDKKLVQKIKEYQSLVEARSIRVSKLKAESD